MTVMRVGLLISILISTTARADVSAAARAFAEGQSAQLEGDYDRAAQSFELAYSNAPSKEALRSAVRARQAAGQLARAATLAELLLLNYPDDAPSAKLAGEVIADARPKFARITVACSSRCVLAIGGRAVSLPPAQTQVVYIAAGTQTIEAKFDDARSATRDITAVAGAASEVQIAQQPLAVAPKIEENPTRVIAKPRPRGGLSPKIALGGGIVAVGLAGAGVWSGLDTNKAHDAYAANPTHDAFVQGRSKQLRTNILFGSAIGAGVISAAVAIWWTRWGGGDPSESPAVSLVPSSDGVFAAYGGSF